MAALIHLDIGQNIIEINDNLLGENILNNFSEYRLVGKVRSRHCRIYLTVESFCI